VTFIEAVDTLMPTFDPEIRRLAERLLIKPRAIDSRVGVFASEVIPGIPGVKPVTIKMIDAKTKEHVETLEVDACLVATGRVPNTVGLGLDAAGITTDRGFVQVDDHMRVLDKKDGKVVPNVYCIGDANGKLMLAHAASAQVCNVRWESIRGCRITAMTTQPADFYLLITGHFGCREHCWPTSCCQPQRHPRRVLHSS